MKFQPPVDCNRLHVGKFKTFLKTHGAIVQIETNEWEVLRCLIRGQTSVLYKNKTGVLTWDSKLEGAYRAWKNGLVWSGLEGERVKNRLKKKPVMHRTLLERDGEGCWFCADIPEDYTLEHLLEISKGGTNHIYNLVLACETCNQSVAHKSIAEKVQYREALRNQSMEEENE